ncbi:hypothetical protein [Brunnivagina elsteri]|uniref:PhoD-like phosphatase n=1 Tax=Brunnivagina elsteri CCALA 953 TaxID=987040 RepID=A0A2A2TKG2_9CYAN|nr:hypothetical protein [Calothrix elsteri]PAX56564.1 hypothetical protein CK510_09995 [Calothrix elsteri CCALA 953]
MVWMPLRERIDTMPLVLAGPILRRTEPNAVTVWVALKASCHVTLKVLDLNYNLLLFDSQKTIKIGTNLHVVAVTAKAESNVLLYGDNYLYDLEFDGKTLDYPGILNASGSITDITYPLFNLPSFALPPHDLNQLRIVHGSCRKLHGESLDAMAGLDKMIREALIIEPKQRPHQLFLTGDQIYADDVADALLLILMEASETLLGWSEPLPDVKRLDELKPGKRNNLATKIAGLTASIDKFNRITNIDKSHLFTFGEFITMYLFAWSDVLWSQLDNFPEYTDINQNSSLFGQAEKEFKKDIIHLKNFLSTLPKVRRALANIPTYMIFDDHEITDDWNLNMAWCDRVLSKPLGRRILQNGLLAYAICQAWGNTPNQFTNHNPGDALLKAAQNWFASGATDIISEQEITRRIGLPTIADIRNTNPRQLPQFDDAIQWHYTIQAPGYEVIFLDTRTRRGFPGKEFDFPALLSESACQQQIPDSQQPIPITFIISPGPVVGLPFLEGIQKSAKTVAEKLGTAAWGFDPEAWGLEPIAFEQFLARLASRNPTQKSRVVILSGDVHYSFAARLQYSAVQPFSEVNNQQNNQTNQQLVIVQFTSSSFKNEKREAGGSYSLHIKGFIPFKVIDHHPKAEILGWANSTGGKLEIGNYYTYSEEFMQYLTWQVKAQPAIVNLVEKRTWFRFLEVLKKPEWWYRIDFLSAKLEDVTIPDYSHSVNPKYIIAPLPKQDRNRALENYLATAKNHREHKGLWGHGKEIVGVNNFGEITFEFDDNKQIAVQTLWWRLESYEDNQLLETFPLTRYEISLSFDDKECPMDDVLREVE